jgi:uncharacterized membrane protein YdbT with pleckstrin-like domain
MDVNIEKYFMRGGNNMEETLNEQKFRPVWRSFYGHIAAMAVCLVIVVFASVKVQGYWKEMWLFFLAVVFIIAVHMLYKRVSVILIVKPDEVAVEQGFIKRSSVEISIRSIRTIQVTLSIIQRILNIGDIHVASSGTDDYEISVSNMPDPYAIRNNIQVYERVTEKS